MSLPRLHRTAVRAVVVVLVATLLGLGVLAEQRGQPSEQQRGERPAPAVEPRTHPVAGTEIRRLRLAELPRGPRPRTGYAAGSAYLPPHGPRTPLPAPHGLSGVAPWGERFLVADTRWFEGTLGLALRGAGGRLVREWPSAGTPVAARDGRVAWSRVTVSEATHPGPARLFVGHRDGAVRAQTVRPGIVHPLGFAGHRLVFARAWGGGLFLTDLRARPHRLPWSPRHPGPVDPGGRRIVTLAGSSLRVVRLSDGTLLHRLVPPRGWVTSLAWEDRRHLLAVVQQGTRAAVVRLGLDGLVERATPVRRATDPDLPAWVLALGT